MVKENLLRLLKAHDFFLIQKFSHFFTWEIVKHTNTKTQ